MYKSSECIKVVYTDKRKDGFYITLVHVFVFLAGQCEFSFAKTAVVMEMNKKEMDRYDSIYR